MFVHPRAGGIVVVEIDFPMGFSVILAPPLGSSDIQVEPHIQFLFSWRLS